MRVLIPTQVNDIHAKAVHRALATRGHEAVLWYGCDLPSRQTLSLELDGRGSVEIELLGHALATRGPFDVIWLRRPNPAQIVEELHPGDRMFAEREWQRMLSGLWRSGWSEAFWINPYGAAQRANDKAEQLAVAARVGLRVPKTLFSSDPRRIREFIRSNPGQTIYKPFLTAQWRLDEGDTAYLFTSLVEEDDLPDDELLRQCPGIFQPRIDKSHELRVTFMGHHAFAVRLDSQAVDVARVDWRIGTRALAISDDSLPPAVEARCRALMAQLGLVFACFDFIVTPQGEHVFLELNEMGQFLWLEEMDERMCLLDAFCEFLIQGRPDFEWRRDAARLRFADFRDPSDPSDEVDELDRGHVEPKYPNVVDDRTAPAANPIH
ncbi:hypothetical protein ACNOYE_38105 [Nannocystaceae bacterium ST9]